MSSSPSPQHLRHAPASFDKQLHLADLISDLPWHFDMATGTLSFGDRYRWHAQVLGTESYENNTWLWAWANEASNIADVLLEAAHTMLELGEEQGIPELLQPQFPLEQADGHLLSLIASCVCHANTYFRGAYDGGAVFLLIDDDLCPMQKVEHPLAHIASVFPQRFQRWRLPKK